MTAKPVNPRRVAHQDAEDAIDHYLREAGTEIARAFIDALQQAFQSVAHHPTAGSPRYAHELNLPGLRMQQLRRFPYLVFYMERDDHIDVWRILHGQRDIAAWMQEPDAAP